MVPRPPRALPRLSREPAREPEPGEITEVRARYRAVGLPRVILPAQRVCQLPIDPRVAYVLSCIDGQSTVETLVDVTGFEAGEILAVLGRLLQLGAIELLDAR